MTKHKRHRQHIKGMRVWNHFFRKEKTTWKFQEEKEPDGERGKLLHMSFYKPIHGSSDLNNVLVIQVPTHPWFIILWEPLNTKAPNPQKAQPYCCYSNTVIFYVRGYILRPWSTLYGGPSGWQSESPGCRYEQWDETTTRLRWEDVVEYNGQLFKCGGGTVVWAKNRWWMRHWARKHETLDQKIKSP